eukprot:1985740-Pyramimonas_sp.AAC.1
MNYATMHLMLRLRGGGPGTLLTGLHSCRHSGCTLFGAAAPGAGRCPSCHQEWEMQAPVPPPPGHDEGTAPPRVAATP